MDSLLASLQDAAEGQIDFQGQRLAEMLSTVLLIIFGAASFVVGYIQQEIYLTLWIGIAGTAFTALVVVPPWPFYNQNPQPWLNSKTGGAVRNVPGIIVDGVKVG